MRVFRVAYDGTEFRGFQRQPHGETVEDAVFAALARLDVCDGNPPAGYSAAGRTDAGVSARAQTIAFEAPDWLTPHALNGELPDTIRAWAAAAAPTGFHATHDARERHYRYFLHAADLDTVLARSVCERVSGDHDFHNLTPDDEGTHRELVVECTRDGEFLVVTCRGGGFPRQLVRRLVSLLERVASGERDLAFVDRVLGADPVSGPDGVPPAPPGPLVLVDVTYPELHFEVDETAAARARSMFERRRRDRLAAGQVAATLSRLDIDRSAP